MIVDLFAGPGGWDVGARMIGLDPIGIEWDKAACQTRAAAGLRTICADVTTLKPPVLGIHGILASPPCTDWSVAGRRMERDGATGHLVDEPMRWVEEAWPMWVALEQVPTVLPVWMSHAERLETMGYSVWVGKLHAEQYGVPQTRTRAFLLASRMKEVKPPEPCFSRYYPRNPMKIDEGKQPWISMATALGWGLTHRPSTTLLSRQHANGRATGGVRALDGGSGARQTYKEAYNNGWWMERPSPTIVGSFRPDIVAAPGWRKAGDGPRQNAPGSVQVTIEEAAVLQSFPRDYPWQGSRSKQFQQVGNAVPPLLAKAVLEVLV